MRVRILQAKDDDNTWYDDAYAFEDSAGQVVFEYNLTWEKIGSYYNGKLRESGVSLDQIEMVIDPGERMQWLPVQTVADEEAEVFLEALNEACAIPKPRSIKQRLAA